MLTRIVALIVILICTSIAWAILGGTIFSRTYSTDPALKNKVESSWGTPQSQKPPHAEVGILHQAGPKVVRRAPGVRHPRRDPIGLPRQAGEMQVAHA